MVEDDVLKGITGDWKSKVGSWYHSTVEVQFNHNYV